MRKYISFILSIMLLAISLLTGCTNSDSPSTKEQPSPTVSESHIENSPQHTESNSDISDSDITPVFVELSKGSDKESVKKLQARLVELGYLPSGVDGDYGANTKHAVEVFQSESDIPVTGTTDLNTYTALFSADAKRAPVTKDHPDVLDANHKKDYYIIVYTDNCKVLVLGKDEYGRYNQVIKCFTCSVGKTGKETPTGVFKISKRYDWRAMFGNVFAQYVVKFNGNYLFHSVPYFSESPDDLEMEEYEKLGTPASLGCIRLCVRDAKWLYDNAINGVQVRILAGVECTEEPEPIPSLNYEDKYKGWDPTDPHTKNPYNK